MNEESKNVFIARSKIVRSIQHYLDNMLIAWTLIPALLLILSFVAMIFFPLRGKKWDDEKAQLAKRHEEKEAIYEQEILKKEEQK